MASVFASKFSTFENKRILFNHVISTFHKEYKENNLKGLHKKLDDFNTHRNRVAHFVLDPNMPALEHFKATSEVTFVKFERSIEVHTYSVEGAEKLAREIITFVEPIAMLNDSFCK